MAQSALTVTAPNPTPPHNFQFTGTTAPNPPNYTKVNYAEPFGDLDANGNWTGTSLAPGDRKNPNPPPFYDDGTPATAIAFATNKAALASGTGATSGGTEGSYPGTDTPPMDTVNAIGAVPASTSVAPEGAGAEDVKTQTYAAGVLVPGVRSTYLPLEAGAWTAGDPGGPVRTVGLTPAVALVAGALFVPNAAHASSLSPTNNPTLTSIASAASGAGTTDCVATGTNFTPQSVIYVNGVAQATVFTSATSIHAPTAPKKATPGTVPVYVITGGVVTTATVNWTFT